jgi:dienelactone hydrolase
LLFGEALQHHLQVLPRVDAGAQVLLGFCYGGKEFLASVALFKSV